VNSAGSFSNLLSMIACFAKHVTHCKTKQTVRLKPDGCTTPDATSPKLKHYTRTLCLFISSHRSKLPVACTGWTIGLSRSAQARLALRLYDASGSAVCWTPWFRRAVLMPHCSSFLPPTHVASVAAVFVRCAFWRNGGLGEAWFGMKQTCPNSLGYRFFFHPKLWEPAMWRNSFFLIQVLDLA